MVERRLGLLCPDVHKPSRPLVPCIGGFAPAAGLLVGLAALGGSEPQSPLSLAAWALAASLLLALIVGLLDDFVNLRALHKIVLGVLPAIPFILSGAYVPRPWVPFLGHVRLTILYPLLVAAAFTVYQNGANMLDTHNGVLPVFTLAVHTGALALKLLEGAQDLGELHLALLLVVVVATYSTFNVYPAKVFNGNAGAFLLGASIAAASVVLRLEFYYLLASTPMFVNGLYYISSVKGFVQKEDVERPVEVDSEGCMRPSRSPRAPVTLVRLALTLSGGELDERGLVVALYVTFFASSAMAVYFVHALQYI